MEATLEKERAKEFLAQVKVNSGIPSSSTSVSNQGGKVKDFSFLHQWKASALF